jgi:hypothetical protein
MHEFPAFPQADMVTPNPEAASAGAAVVFMAIRHTAAMVQTGSARKRVDCDMRNLFSVLETERVRFDPRIGCYSVRRKSRPKGSFFLGSFFASRQ